METQGNNPLFSIAEPLGGTLMGKAIIGVFILLLASGTVLAQERSPAAAAPPSVPNAEERLRFAASTSSYPVTPGDVYRLTFQQGGAPSTLDVIVGSDYTIQLNVFGKVNAAGMTFAQVKQTIERAVRGRPPMA